MPQLNEVIISITNKCNMHCRMCDIPKELMEELSTRQWKQVITDAFKIGAYTIVFSGGEPLLRKDIYELIAWTRQNKMNACVTSNGVLIDQSTAERLKQSGVNVINISIEGTEQIHDLLRGKGSYQKAIKALQTLKTHNIEATVAATVSAYNYNDLASVMDVARDHGATTVRFQPFNALFIQDKNRCSEFLLEKDNVKCLYTQIDKIKETAKRYNIATNPAAYLELIPGYLSRQAINKSGGCLALYTSCPINARGDVFLCWVLAGQDTKIGNVKEESFCDIWESSRHIAMRRKIQDAAYCQGCLMSCYDEVYGSHSTMQQLVNKAKKISTGNAWVRQKNKVMQQLRRRIHSWKARYIFYKSYRGPIKNIFIRGVNSFARKRRLHQQKGCDESVTAMATIEKCKQILRGEKRRYQ